MLAQNRDDLSNRYSFDKDSISIQAHKGKWGAFKRWIGNTWLGRKITTGNFGAIKIKDGERFLDKTSLICSVNEYILLKQKDNFPEYVVDALKHNKSIGDKIISYTCEEGEKKRDQHGESYYSIRIIR